MKTADADISLKLLLEVPPCPEAPIPPAPSQSAQSDGKRPYHSVIWNANSRQHELTHTDLPSIANLAIRWGRLTIDSLQLSVTAQLKAGKSQHRGSGRALHHTTAVAILSRSRGNAAAASKAPTASQRVGRIFDSFTVIATGHSTAEQWFFHFQGTNSLSMHVIYSAASQSCER